MSDTDSASPDPRAARRDLFQALNRLRARHRLSRGRGGFYLRQLLGRLDREEADIDPESLRSLAELFDSLVLRLDDLKGDARRPDFPFRGGSA